MRKLVFLSSALAGLAVVMPLAEQIPILRSIPVLYLVAFLPVTAAGVCILVLDRRFLDMAPTTMVLAMTLFGVFWSDLGDIPRAFLLFFTFLTTIAFGAVLCTEDYWVLAARTFVLFSTISACILALDFLGGGSTRLGSVSDSRGIRIIEPNQAGTQAAFAILVGIVLLSTTCGRRRMSYSNALILPCLPILVSCLLLSQSRGAILSFVGSLLMMLVLGRIRKRVELLMMIPVAIAIVPFAWYSLSDSLLARFSGAKVQTYGGRTEIWRAAADLMFSDTLTFIFGAGSGGAASSLGRFAPYLGDYLAMSVYSGYEGGVLRVNTHSSYFEWWLSFGLIGIAVGLFVIILLLVRSFKIDRHRLLAAGTGLVTFFLLTSFSLIAYRLLGISIAAGALTIGYLFFERGKMQETSRNVQPVIGASAFGPSVPGNEANRSHRQAAEPVHSLSSLQRDDTFP